MKDKITANATVRIRRDNSITIYGEGGSKKLVVIHGGKILPAEIAGDDALIDSAFGVLSLPLSEVEILHGK